MIRCLAATAKDSNRIDVVKHLRDITPAGTTGEFASSIWLSVNSFIHQFVPRTVNPTVMFTTTTQQHSLSSTNLSYCQFYFAGPLLPGKLDICDIPVENWRDLTVDLTGKFEQKPLKT